ncbi:MAG: TadE/TadG family type IV pilus assembly protein [Caulobacteraceae bacterium]
MLPRAGRSWRDLVGHTGGVAAIEFALVIPLVIIVYAGGFEIVQAATVNRKLTDTTVQLANVTTQYTSVALPDLNAISGASSQIMAPYPTSSLTIVVSEIYTDTNSHGFVKWSQGYGAPCLPTNSPVTLPPGFASASSFYVLVQTTYSYAPTIGGAFVHTIPMTDQIFMVPRQSPSIPATGTSC